MDVLKKCTEQTMYESSAQFIRDQENQPDRYESSDGEDTPKNKRQQNEEDEQSEKTPDLADTILNRSPYMRYNHDVYPFHIQLKKKTEWTKMTKGESICKETSTSPPRRKNSLFSKGDKSLNLDLDIYQKESDLTRD